MDKQQAQEDLAFIKRVMADSQRVLIDNGKIFIMLSLTALVGICIKIIKELLGYTFNNLYIWIPIIFAGWLITVLYKRQVYTRLGGQSYTTRAMDGIWTAFGISACILGIIGYISGGVLALAVAPVLMVLFGCGQYMSGMVSNLRWIRAMAYGWWSAAIITFFWPGEYAVLILGLLLILFQLIPGLMLYQQWKKESHA
jgi:hypothetical protein